MQALLAEVVYLRNSGWRSTANQSGLARAERMGDIRVPFSVRYDLYSSLSCGASDFRGSNLIATGWLFSKFAPSKTTPKEPSPIFLPTRKCAPTMPFDVADCEL